MSSLSLFSPLRCFAESRTRRGNPPLDGHGLTAPNTGFETESIIALRQVLADGNHGHMQRDNIIIAD
jgi:hypothetical protein